MSQVSTRPVDFSRVMITDSFWRPKQEKVATVTLDACIVQTEQKTGRIRNFEKAARNQGEVHEGFYFDDSDVYKALEAIAYSLRNRPNAALEHKADEWIDKIVAAQRPDGYLNTYFTLTGISKRWTDMEKHEDYCAGHLIEAAVAYYQTTHKRKLLDAAIRLADHIDTNLRQQGRHWVSGHEEIELALMKLYHTTMNDRYLQLAEWYLEQRGHGYGRGPIWGENGREGHPEYCQDSIPVKEQTRIQGHAVRAMYLYTGAADVAAVTGDAGYMSAMQTVWQDVVHRNMYVTGGIGSSGSNEGFSQEYDLPNVSAYCETCASVGMVFWNQRMGLMTGNSQYMDILERTLYNGALDGISLGGDRFFYGNPLASEDHENGDPHLGHRGRSEWFGVACCPSNIARLIASLGGYIYGASDSDIWVNLFIGNEASITLRDKDVRVKMLTEYPWAGRVQLELDPASSTRFGLRIRMPGWSRGVAVPGDLYRFHGTESEKCSLLVNGEPAEYQESDGYAVIERQWSKGDVIIFEMPMHIRKLSARGEVVADRNCVAIQRGPLVYCIERKDNDKGIWNIIVPDEAPLVTHEMHVLDESIVSIRTQVRAITVTQNGREVETESRDAIAVPYYTWANRGAGDMQVWLPTNFSDLKINA